jgi:hypothetical protein
MRAIQFKLGWKEVAPLQIAQSIIRATNVLKGKLPTPAAWAAGLGLDATSALRRLVRDQSRMVVRSVDRFGAAHDQLWREAAADLTTAVVRDASYLNWKYRDQPGQKYLAMDIVDDGVLQGVAIWLLRGADVQYAYRRAYLVDFVARLNERTRLRAVLTAACSAAADSGADALLCMHVDSRLTDALRACGFHLRKPGRVLLVDPGSLTGDALRHALSPSSWYVTQGDSDIDRP